MSNTSLTTNQEIVRHLIKHQELSHDPVNASIQRIVGAFALEFAGAMDKRVSINELARLAVGSAAFIIIDAASQFAPLDLVGQKNLQQQLLREISRWIEDDLARRQSRTAEQDAGVRA